jgi:hypothetical protein
MINFFRRFRQRFLSENKFSKYILYAIGEIILVVIGILIALQVNNWNESRLEQKRINQYAKSLVEDLKSDIEMINVSLFQATKKYRYVDSLRHYTNHTKAANLSNTFLYVVAHDIIYRPYKWNRSTLNELNSSGGFRYIANDSLQKKLVAYQSFSKHLDEDFEFDKTAAYKIEEQIATLLNLNSPYIKKLLIEENRNFNDPAFSPFETDEYKTSKANDLKLISYDTANIQIFINSLILVQDQYRVRAFKEMTKIIEDAQQLIDLIKKEYQIK